MTEEELMARVQAGETALYEEIMERTKGRLMAFTASYFRWDLAEAEEMSQQVYIKAYQNRRHYKADRPFRPWFFVLARNLCLDQLRKRKRHPETHVFPEFPSPGPDPEKAAMKAQERQFLIHALESLPLKQREVVNLVRQGFSYQEISELLGMTQVSARNNLSFGLKKLREMAAELEK